MTKAAALAPPAAAKRSLREAVGRRPRPPRRADTWGIRRSRAIQGARLPFPVKLGWSQHWSGYFHASQPWFEERDWTIWDGIPGATVSDPVARLVRAGSAKPRASIEGTPH